MQKNITAILLTAAVAMTGCTVQEAEKTVVLSQQEKEIAAVAEWFSESMTDGEDFPDIKDYQYYARAVGLDKDATDSEIRYVKDTPAGHGILVLGGKDKIPFFDEFPKDTELYEKMSTNFSETAKMLAESE